MDSRKEAILEAIVRDYVETGIPVGSLGLVQKYQFPFSTATIRAEMAELERLGFLAQPHISAGRVPTEAGYRYYVNLLENERSLSREAGIAKKRILSMGPEERRLAAASEVISDITRSMGFVSRSGEVFSHGLGYLFAQPEFTDPHLIVKTAELIDNLNTLFEEIPYGIDSRIYIGSEAPIGKSAGCSIILSRFNSDSGNSFLGLIGPMRMSYDRNLSVVNTIKEILEEIE